MKTTSCNEPKQFAFDNAPRCCAKTKRNNGKPCRAPAVHGKKRCRIHGGSKGSGAQVGNSNAYKHGFTASQVKDFKKTVRELITESAEIIGLFVNET